MTGQEYHLSGSPALLVVVLSALASAVLFGSIRPGLVLAGAFAGIAGGCLLIAIENGERPTSMEGCR